MYPKSGVSRAFCVCSRRDGELAQRLPHVGE
jgi:hypothetical protein